MSKKEKIGFGFITIIAVAYFIYHLSHLQKKSPTNVFLDSKVKIKSLNSQIKDQEILKLDGRSFKFSELPDELQKQIRNEQMIAHEKINTLLKEYVIRYYLATLENPGKKIDTRNLPDVKMTENLKTSIKEVEAIYESNKQKFPADHDPQVIKADLAVKLMGGKIEAFLKQNLAQLYKNDKLSLPAYPQLPENWFQNPITQTLGDSKAKNHLVWIGDYVEPNLQETKKEVGLLIKKYGLTNFRISFIPISPKIWDFSQALNLRAVCVSKLHGSDAFWSFHAQLLTKADQFIKVSPKEREKAVPFTKEILTSLGYKPNAIAAVEACAENKKKDNPLYIEILKATKSLQFIPNNTLPIFIFNGRYLDLAGRNLFDAVNSQIITEEPKS